jgi:AraC family transcriptional regulator
MNKCEAMSPGRESFFGAPWRSASAGGFAVTLWFAETFGNDVLEHEHDHAHLMIVLDGRYHSRVAGADEHSLPIIFNPPGTCHRDRFLTPGSFMSVTVSPTQWDAVAGEQITDDPVCVRSRGACGLASKLMRHVASERPKEALVGESLCTELLSIAATMPSTDRRRPLWLDRAIEALTADLACEVCLAEIARNVGVHPCHMTRSFRAFERCTPGEYLARARLHRAARLLSEARLPLADVALAAGFADQSHFSKRFRGSYGLSPGEYRRRTARRHTA